MKQSIAAVDESVLGRALVVDDDANTRDLLAVLLEQMGLQVVLASNGAEALELLVDEVDNLDVVMLDWAMPEMDGMAVLQSLKKTPGFETIPVVMVTGMRGNQRIKQGIDAGVFYYLQKPFDQKVFESVVEAALREAWRVQALSHDLESNQDSLQLLHQANFKFSSHAQAENLAAFLAGCFPHPELLLPGIEALLVNAVEHGLLGIGYERKQQLLEENCWHEALERLQKKLPPERQVWVSLNRTPQGIELTVVDDGKGFAWQRYKEQGCAHVMANHGCGIARADQLFDQLTYNKKGNAVSAVLFC